MPKVHFKNNRHSEEDRNGSAAMRRAKRVSLRDIADTTKPVSAPPAQTRQAEIEDAAISLEETVSGVVAWSVCEGGSGCASL